MFLKRIELLGFKSFADRTVIEFDEGVTALLGPNGCGKSNIVDAVKWVLGEQSVRNMRAERMEDVIFSGTENRKALSVAEVTLTIANEKGILDIERPEIAIKRRIYREGEGEYYLNGAAVRLKEIRELFFDTGVGKSAYSVMEQGRIDQVLSNKPEERRYLFEEAAGITKFKMRSGEAERKLQRTEQNMAGVENILHEVRRNYQSLERQTRKTLEYRRLREIVFETERDLKLLQWGDLESAQKKKAARLNKVCAGHSDVMGRIDEIKAILAGEFDQVNAMEKRLIETRKHLYGMDLEKKSQDKLIRTILERRVEIAESQKRSGEQEKSAEAALKSLNDRKIERESALAQLQNQLKQTALSINTREKTIESAERRIDGNTRDTAAAEASLAAQEKHREGLQDDLRGLTDDIVKQLDIHLTESGYDRNRRYFMEENIIAGLQSLRTRTENRTGALKGFIGGGSSLDGHSAEAPASDSVPGLPSTENTYKIIKNTAGELEEITAELERAELLFKEYRSSGAEFLQDFLAPEGIITRKRELDERIGAASGKIREIKNRIAALGDEKERLSITLKESRDKLEEFRVAQARTAAQASAAEDSLLSLARELESEEARLLEIRRQIAAEEAKINSLDEQKASAAAKREELERKQENLRGDMAGLETDISTGTEKMVGRKENIKHLVEQRASLELEREKIRLQQGSLQDEEKYLLEDFRDRNSRDLTEFTARKSEIDSKPRELREKLGAVKLDLKALGQVNLMAPEEFTEVSERHRFLNEQLEDLRRAKDDLSLVTEEIRGESARLFLNTYKEIRDHFHEMFRRLFGGGRAEIRLVNPDNPLDSGLEIYAQPPGKKLENISLLSGGEKSLCGVALMFATFLVKPSPFCVLDEIDAALDEANIQRFVNILVEFGRSSQFVVVTHNKKTVTGARNLLGVTMQESGVSRLITLRLDGEEQETENEEPAAVS